MEKDIYEQLSAPFPAKDIEWRIGNVNRNKMEGLAMPYITNRAIMERLDQVFGPMGWQNQFIPWRDNSQLCGISVQEPDSGEWITKWDGADNTAFEGTKGGLSDSMKRAAVQWGIGRYLYNLNAIWVRVVQKGKNANNFAIADGATILLPKWAVPVQEVNERTPETNATVVYAQQQPQQRPQQTAQNPGQNRAQQGAQNQAQQRPQQRPQKGPQQPQQPQRMSRRDYDTILQKARAADLTAQDVDRWINMRFGLNNVYDLNPQQFRALIDALEEAERRNSPGADEPLPWENPNEYLNG